ncbi:MAG: ATP phosphoribosyltransferase regulatory subunit, partial [Chloroflexota bacterium]
MTQQTNDGIQAIRAIENTLQHHMMLFGYETIDLPLIDEAETFLTRAGAGIMERLFTFERGGKLLALRPEFTAVAAHRYVQEGHTEPVRWQMSGSIFEDEASDVSTQYRRHNIGAELIGTSTITSDAEIIAMAIQGVDTLALADWQVVVGHVGLQLHLLSRYQLDKRTTRLLLTQRETLQRDGVDAVLTKLNNTLMLDPDTVVPADDSDANGQTQHMLDVLLDSTRYGSTMGGRTRHDIASRVLKKHSRSLERENIKEALTFLYTWGQLSGEPAKILTQIRKLIA